MTQGLVAKRWIVSGQVQGVGFRWSTLQRATDLGLAGWVRNLPDGRVEVAAKGAPDAIGELDEFLQDGPRMAHVENVEKVGVAPEDIPHNGFHIK